MRMTVSHQHEIPLGREKLEAERLVEQLKGQIKTIEDDLVLTINSEVSHFYNEQSEFIHHLRTHFLKK